MRSYWCSFCILTAVAGQAWTQQMPKLEAVPAVIAEERAFGDVARPSMEQPGSGRSFETQYPPYAGEGADITSAYVAAWTAAEKEITPEELKTLARYKILFVPGFLGNLAEHDPVLQINLPGLKVTVGAMFAEQFKWLQKQKLDFELVKIETEGSPAVNGKVIAGRIAASDKPVILIGHSKGGLDSLSALIKNPGLSGKVAAFISIQTPFLGSPVADAIINSRPLSSVASYVLKKLGGNKSSLFSLTTGARVAYYERKRPQIEQLLRTVRVVNFTSWKNNEPGKVDTVLEPLRNGMAEAGLPNDGLVPAISQILPGANYVKVDGFDHLGPVMENTVLNMDKIRFTRAIVALALR